MRRLLWVGLLGLGSWNAGCEVLQPAGPQLGVPAPPSPGGGTGSTDPAAVRAILERHCTWCHTPQHPAANIDLVTNYDLTPAHWNDMGHGVQHEMAPFIEKLTATDKRTLLGWIRERGGSVPAVTIPSRYTWRLSDELADLRDGDPAPGFAFVIEDAFIDTQGWTVQTYTDKHGRTYKGINLTQTHSVDQSVFSSSRNPSSYLVFAGIPWHGRFYNSRMEGDVRVGRWMSIGMHAREMHPTTRAHRSYVRFQIDRDAISLRSAPTPLETWPWGDRPDPILSGNTNASGFYQTSDEWLHFVFEARRVSNGVQWTAVITNPATGATRANLSALEISNNPLQGTFFLHAYSTGDKRNWANLVFTADVDPAP